MRKNKKLLLGGLSVLTLVAAGSGAVSTFAWFKASSAIALNPNSDDTKNFTVTYEEFGTGVGDLNVTLSFELVTTSKINGLVTYLDSDPDTTGPKVAGWNQCYLEEDGTTEHWNVAATGSLASVYGKNANAYYAAYRVKATFTPTANQKAATIEDHYLKGDVHIVDSLSEGSGKFWTTTTALNADGKTSTPTNAASITTANKHFVAIDITASQASWTADGSTAETVYSDTYVGVIIDGTVHATNEDVQATISFADVSAAASGTYA